MDIKTIRRKLRQELYKIQCKDCMFPCEFCYTNHILNPQCNIVKCEVAIRELIDGLITPTTSTTKNATKIFEDINKTAKKEVDANNKQDNTRLGR